MEMGKGMGIFFPGKWKESGKWREKFRRIGGIGILQTTF